MFARRLMKIGDSVFGEKVLVIMPTYHSRMEWLERSVNSVISQNYENFDCIVVKDGCRHAGDSLLECNSCRETSLFFRSIPDNRFSFYKLPTNLGAAGWGPRNFALMNTYHDLICYLDDDNWYEPDHIEKLYEAIMERESDMAYTGTRLWSSDMRVISERVHPYAPRQGYVDTSEIMHRRKLINNHGGWRKVSKCNDWDMVSRWEDVRWAHTNSVTLNFYVREGCGIHRN
jgi:glycosyltransferase involved in cell wall biosynthesis